MSFKRDSGVLNERRNEKKLIALGILTVFVVIFTIILKMIERFRERKLLNMKKKLKTFFFNVGAISAAMIIIRFVILCISFI